MIPVVWAAWRVLWPVWTLCFEENRLVSAANRTNSPREKSTRRVVTISTS